MFKEGDKVYFRDEDGVHKNYVGEVKGISEQPKYPKHHINVEWNTHKGNNTGHKFVSSYKEENLVCASVVEDNPNWTFSEKKLKGGG